jgi:2-methylcitrate dehydratase PrpD
MNESLALANNIVAIKFDDIPASALDNTKKSLLDAIGVTLAAGALGEGCKEFVNLAIAAGGKKESTIIGFNTKVPSFMAAFANGSMAHALDFEDSHDGALVHPNAATIPAALAVAESLGNINGEDFAASIVLGCDLVCRLGLALNEDLLQYGWYMPPILGAFGATAAASKLLNLSAKQILDAFSLTLCQATCSAELTQNSDSVVRSIRDAFSTKAGVLSALLAKEGVTGFAQPFEGKAGLFNLYAKGNYNPLMLTNGLGKVFEGSNISFKPWPSCRGTHSYIDAVLQILTERSMKPNDIEGIHIVVSTVNKMLCEPLENKQKPATAIDAKFSLPFTIATTLLYRKVTMDSFTPQALKDPRVLELARKITYQVDTNLTKKEAMQSLIYIKTKDGTLSKKVEFPYGHPMNPISQDKLVAKFMDCAAHAANKISEKNLKKIVELVLNLEDVKNIAEITSCL